MKSQGFSTASPGSEPEPSIVAEPALDVAAALVGPVLGALVESAKGYAAAARAAATRKAYAKQCRASE